MNNERKQEMPSVAFIPQGYHAVIDGNKVIIKKGDTEKDFGIKSSDLEEAACEYADVENPTCPCEECLIKTFKAGAQWQKEQDQSTIELAEDHAMLAGMEKMKEEMIDKVCKWLAKHWRKYVWLTDDDVIHFGHWEHDLKRVMEE